MITKLTINSTKLINLLVYSIIHALVDASCAVIIAANITRSNTDLREVGFYIILYNTIAFALQVPIGVIIDYIRMPTQCAALGCILILFSVITYRSVGFALIVAGLGNAIFHVGGGIIALNLQVGKASLPGIFVAPGVIGLLIGAFIGKAKYFTIWPLVLMLIVAVVIILTIKKPALNYSIKLEKYNDKFNIILTCVLVSIVIRSFVGFILNYAWKTNIFLLIVFTLSVAFGKALGGILADCFGWGKITVYGLLISAPLLVLGMNIPYLGMLGIFLFNLTMPVTLTVVSNMLPGRFGFAFGLTTLALIIGALPSFTELKSITLQNNIGIILISVVLMALLLSIGLKLFLPQKDVKIFNNKFKEM